MARLYLLPVLLCFAWWLYLTLNNWPISKGYKGFAYILGLSGVVAGFFLLMMWVTAG